MQTIEFLEKILPTSGLYIIARLVGKVWKHQTCDTIAEAAAYAQNFDLSGVPTYHACASYRERSITTERDGKTRHQVRVHRNVRALKSFWFDLDVKPGIESAYQSQEEAISALATFLQATKLPLPLVVSSGYGVHIYWTLTHEIIPETWKQTAEGLKALAAKLGFKADPACTADSARVLRPVGTFNRKNPDVQRPVELIIDSEPSVPVAFAGTVAVALEALDIKPPAAVVRQVEAKLEAINQAFTIQHDFPPCSGRKVADRCQQLGKIRSTAGAVAEPLWYAGIQLLCHAVEGDELIHEWSKGHATYSVNETNKKISQIRNGDLGPTLCATFESRAPGGCTGCPFQGKISSPAQLGTQVASAPAPIVTFQIADEEVTVILPAPPDPFTRGEGGGIYIEEDGITHRIYEYDCYPMEVAHDEQLGYETVRIRHHMPREGWRECVLQSSLLARPIDFETKLRDHHIQPLIRNKIAMYFDAYLRKLKTDTKMRQLFKAQGWKADDTEFVLGDKLYRKNEVTQAGFSHGAKGFLEHFRSKGSLATWRDLTSIFNAPGLEPHAFMLLVAFAAPLLKLGGRQGFTISALGDTGAGKSTMGKFLASTYGHPDQTWIMRGSTANARAERIGAYYSIPAYMDEITTIIPKELRDLVYLISTGKWRESLTRDRTPREGAEWATILIASTNDSLQSKLQMEKANADAESMRLFEFKFPVVPIFQRVVGEVHSTLSDNYGVAGAKYIQQLVNNRDDVKAELGTVIEKASVSFGMESKERFWSQAIALTVYGGQLAREWGLIDFDPTCIKSWLLKETRRMRDNLLESATDSIAILGEYLNEHMGERLVIETQINVNMAASSSRPSREISQRYEKDTQTLYVSRTHIRDWLGEKHFNYNDMKDDLIARGVLVNPSAKKTLGAGTDYTGGPIACWQVNANHPLLGAVISN